MKKVRLLALICTLVLALSLTAGTLTGCAKKDPVVTPPATEQNGAQDGSQPIESNPVETYVEPGDAPE